MVSLSPRENFDSPSFGRTIWALLIFILCISGNILKTSSLSGTCKDRCFNLFKDEPNKCQCDYKCSSYSNCCDDYVNLCLEKEKAKVSCHGRCYEAISKKKDGNCACDKQCSARQDCCDDYVPACASLITCENRCGAPRDRSLQCQCDTGCMERFDCCIRYAVECGQAVMPGPLPPLDSENTCKGRCFKTASNINMNCSCSANCQKTTTCCDDFVVRCLDPETRKDESNTTTSIPLTTTDSGRGISGGLLTLLLLSTMCFCVT